MTVPDCGEGGRLDPIRWCSVFLIIAAILGGASYDVARAQSDDDAWSEPLNLSRSGAAETPQIVAAPDGTLQAFWWDQFDGPTTAYFDGEAWSDPSPAPIVMTTQVSEEQFISLPIQAMPTIVADDRGWVHAFWIGEPDEETDIKPLLHSQMPVGSSTWSRPTAVAESAISFELAVSPPDAPAGGLTLAYVRTLHTAANSAGIYVRRTAGGGAGWGPSVAVDETVYFRPLELAPEEAYLRVANADDRIIHLAWDDPRLEWAMVARSTDGGSTWSQPEALGEPDDPATHPHILPLPGGSGFRLWETAGSGGCTLHQQRAIGLTGTPTGTDILTPTWSAAERVLESVSRCPRAERSWPQGEGLLWIWGEGTGALGVAAWDGVAERWSEPRDLTFRFLDAETERWVDLDNLHATLISDTLAVVGSDLATGEVWGTTGRVSAMEMAFAPPSPWVPPTRLSEDELPAGWPAVVVDADGRVHVAWSQAAGPEGPYTTLFHASWDDAPGSRPRTGVVAPQASGAEIARQPALTVDTQGLLHLVWSGGEQGEITYSRAQADQAAFGAWSAPRPLPAPSPVGSWPQIGADTTGRLHVVYAVPLNEKRGIYVTQSGDGGDTWSEPAGVFDAAAAGWAAVDHPALAVAADGTLHVAWVQGALPDTWPPRGVYYARSTDGGDTWTQPREMAGTGYDWPRLALLGGDVHLLYARASGGGIWHRAPGTEGEAGNGRGWRAAVRVPGWDGAAGPYALTISGPATGPGGTLHLVGADAAGESLLHTTFDGARWSALETVPLKLAVDIPLGVAAAAPPDGGRLGVAFRALAAGEAGEPRSSIFSMVRTIPTEETSPAPIPAATSMPDAPPTPTPEPETTLSPTPDLTGVPAASGSLPDPLLLGGGLAVVVVVGTVATRLLLAGKR